MIRVIIAGGRDYDDYAALEAYMDKVLVNATDGIQIVCGMAKGADTLGERYAKKRGYDIAYFPADWDRYGKSAGYKRNVQMAENADALVAFWDGKSKGTGHMIDIARAHGLGIRIKPY